MIPFRSAVARIGAIALITCCVAGSPWHGQEARAQGVGGLTAPSRSGSRLVRNPQAIAMRVNPKLALEVTSGETDADAINAAAAQLREAGGGASYVKTESGIGAVSVGVVDIASPEASGNPTLEAMRRRFLRAKAHLAARALLAKLLEDTRDDGKQELVKQRDLLDLDASRPPSSAKPEERATEIVNAFLRGAVFYDCEEDAGKVYVTVISTPRSQGDVSFGGFDFMTVSNLQAAKDLVMSEVHSGVVPPQGGRVLAIPGVAGDDRLVAWFAWGCEYVQANADEHTQARIAQDAADASGLMAESALIALMRGERIQVESAFASKEFANFASDWAKGSGVDAATESTVSGKKKELAQLVSKSVTMRSVVEGKVPQCVERTLPMLTDDGEFYYTVLCCVTSWPGTAEASPLGKSDRRAKAYSIADDGTFEMTKDGRLKPKSAATGNGRVTADKDL